MSGINQTTCQMREVVGVLHELACDGCQRPAPCYGTAERLAIDLDLDQPTLLAFTVSVHHCVACRHCFRAQPPFLLPDAIYTNRAQEANLRVANVHDVYLIHVNLQGAPVPGSIYARPFALK